MKRKVVPCLVGGLLASCLVSGAPAFAGNILKDLVKIYNTYQEVNMMLWLSGDTKAEKRVGEETKWFINLTNKREKDPQINRWVSSVWERVKPQFRDRGMDYNLTILKGKEVNAFALPGGNIFIYKGMLDFIGSDDEMAAVLAHELSHAEKRHSLKQLRNSVAFQMILQNAVKNKRDRDSWGQVVGALTMLKFSRDDEDEADDLGQKKMTAAGFNPMGQVKLWEKFVQKFGKGGGVEQYLSTHPPSQKRVENARNNLAKLVPGGDVTKIQSQPLNLSFSILADSEENLVQNGSFESDVAKKGLPDAWTVKEGNASKDESCAITGKQALKLFTDNTMKQVRVVSELIAVNPAEKYVLRGNVCAGEGNQRVSIGAELYDKSKKLRGFIWPVLSGGVVSTQWTKFVGTFEVGALPQKNLSKDTAFIRILLQQGPLSKGIVWFDDLKLQRGSYKPPQNFLTMGSFEQDDGAGRPSGIEGTPNCLSRDLTKFKIGYSSLKMISNGGVTECEFAPIDLKEFKDGQQPNCSFHFMGNKEFKGKLEIVLMDESGNPLKRKLVEREFATKPDLWMSSGAKFDFRLSEEEKNVAKSLCVRVSSQIPQDGALWVDGFIMR